MFTTLQKHFRETVPNTVTLPQLFQKNGSFAARVGKIYHYGNPGQIGTDGLDDPPSWNQKVNPKGIDKSEEPLLTNYTPGRGLGSSLCFYASPGKDEEHTDGMVATETIRLMEENRNRPWFLGAGFYRPHCPYIAPRSTSIMVPLSKVKLVPFEEWEMSIAPQWAYFTSPANWGLNEKQRLEVMQAYYASILFMDAQVGRLLQAWSACNCASERRSFSGATMVTSGRARPVDEADAVRAFRAFAADHRRSGGQGARQSLPANGRVSRHLSDDRRPRRTS